MLVYQNNTKNISTYFQLSSHADHGFNDNVRTKYATFKLKFVKKNKKKTSWLLFSKMITMKNSVNLSGQVTVIS